MEETNEPIIPAQPVGLVLLQDAQFFLHETGRWAKFLGIMGFIGSGFLMLLAFFFGAFMSAMSTLSPYSQSTRHFPAIIGGVGGFILYGSLAVVYFFISLNLYQFGDGVKQAVELGDSIQLSIAFGKLKLFFKIKGIILIAVLCLYGLIIIGGIIIAAFIMHR
ncbi:MAG: hypothetical protein JWQ34_2401 [Mucilaginibacter sp.]|uniref:hypothetical protein n=1 Tax=Mucilaginibacter sp. TaxID=1882438 RepID=UPI0026116293|nr:hypothetical protein [Mucilaginibacter sp.]MDB5004176.1 hypothetical protein [Mucilaginibacter sp.]